MTTTAQLAYAATMVVLVTGALGVAWRERRALAIAKPGYRAQLLEPARLIALVVGLAAFVLAAPYTGDPTWDAIDATFMSIGCYVAAPWTLASLFRRVKNRASVSATELVLAVVAWWTVASASYDLYLLARDGAFPPTSAENALASTVLYVLGGLFFSLGLDARRGLVFVFMHEDWPTWHGDRWTPSGAARASLLALAIATPVVVYIVWVVTSELGLLR